MANVLGRAPLIPCFIGAQRRRSQPAFIMIMIMKLVSVCFIGGNSHPTIPYRFKDDQRIGHASADTQRDRGNGNRLYEVNIWMWRYGRGRPRMVSIAEAERIRAEWLSESRTRAAETRKRRSEAAAAAGTGQGGGGADLTVANDIICQIIYKIMYDIIGMNYDIIVNTIAYDIIVNITPVISGTLHYQGPWPAFAGQPYLSHIYIPMRSN